MSLFKNIKNLIISSLIAFSFVFSANATIIYESATMGPTGNLGGASIGYSGNQMVGSRFSLTANYNITAIGGHINTHSGSVWGAIVELSSSMGLPTFHYLDIESHAIVSTLFEDTGISGDLRQSIDLLLAPGHYALIFGAGSLFASSGNGAMPNGGQSSLPSASYFFSNNGHPNWVNTGDYSYRFVVEGVEAIPEPATISLMGLGLIGLGFSKRRKQ